MHAQSFVISTNQVLWTSSEWAAPHIVLLRPVSSSHWGIAGNCLLMSGLWPLAPTLTALDPSISVHCLWSSWGLSTSWPLTPWWPVGISTTGLGPASLPLRILIKQPILKPLQKDIEAGMTNIHPLKNTYFQCTQNKWIENGFLAVKNNASGTIFMKLFECSSCLVPSSTATDFANWFPFILREELITKISRCSAGMDGEAAASSLEPNDWNLYVL